MLAFILILVVLGFLTLVTMKFVPGMAGAKFKLKSPLLSEPEQQLYKRLTAALPDQVVLAQVAFSQMTRVSGGTPKGNFRKYGTTRQNVADFVICDTAFKILAVVELDDSTHSREKDEHRDAIVAEAGSRTVRWHVSRMPPPEEIWRLVLAG